MVRLIIARLLHDLAFVAPGGGHPASVAALYAGSDNWQEPLDLPARLFILTNYTPKTSSSGTIAPSACGPQFSLISIGARGNRKTMRELSSRKTCSSARTA
jgi:hypothetical protein